MCSLKYIVAGLLSFLGAAEAFAISRDAALQQVLELRRNNHKKIEHVDQQISQQLNRLSISETKKLAAKEQDLQQLARLRQEYLLRQDFFDRLSFLLESKYHGQAPLQQFLAENFLHLSKIELKEGGPEAPLWKVLAYLGTALKEVSERNESTINFINSYINAASLSRPLAPADFLQSRNYINGKISRPGSPRSREEIGHTVDQRLQLSISDNEGSEDQSLQVRSPVRITLKSQIAEPSQ